ncbi:MULTISPECIES: DUF1302 domain-containing protein [Pseudomonas]|uniref:DUF1302 domain-containing protein n=1 Tax=Pseudomonas TaxID=286 RepID=UPI000D001859|nr:MULTISPECIES: DUF1302 family protein [Pseudomonas]PRA43879.1 hypothetical protein CQZ98_27205 [Pseudomonas sp. MYb115]QXN52636.1 DUF1302 domain-containing protein [Pseudomonas fluorescens]WSO26977.1 DUF1302 family protein [Pseudomonas fluorescens]
MFTRNTVARRSGRPAYARTLLATAITLGSAAASAGPSLQLGEDTTLDSTLTVNYTASMRTAKQASQYLNDPNNDDGTRNFKRGSLINNRLSLFGELQLKHDNLGAVLRGSHFYDDAYHQRNANDSPDTVNKLGHNDGFSDKTRELSGGRARLLDAYVYGNFDVGETQYLSLKAGRHLVAWGESLFWSNISQGQAPVDATKFNVPGTEAKDSYLPVGQVSGSWSLNEDLALVGYYQYEWEKTDLNPVGDYFGSDTFGPGAEFFRLGSGQVSSLPNAAAVAFAGDKDASDSGQWGLGVRYRITENTEVGVFHYRYNERVGSMFFDFTGTTRYSSLKNIGHTGEAMTYRLGYFEDVKLTGISFSSKVGDSVQYAGDLSYRDGAAVYLASGAPTTGQIWQGNLNTSYILGPSLLAQQTTFMAEVVHQRIAGVDKLTISGGGPGVDGTFDNFESDTQTRGSTLLGIGAYMDYPSVATGLDLSTKVVWTQNVDGSAYQGLGRDEKRLTLGGDFKYLGNFQIGMTYVAYLSSPDVAQGRLLADRDYLSLNAKYSF